MTDLAWTGWDWPHCGGGPNSRSLLVRRASERESARTAPRCAGARSSESCPHQSLARIVFLASADTPTRAFLQPLVSLMSAHPVRTFGEGSAEAGAGAMLVACRLRHRRNLRPLQSTRMPKLLRRRRLWIHMRQFHDDCRSSRRGLLLRDRRRAFRHMVGLRADLSGYGHDPKRQHPNHHDCSKGDRQRASDLRSSIRLLS